MMIAVIKAAWIGVVFFHIEINKCFMNFIKCIVYVLFCKRPKSVSKNFKGVFTQTINPSIKS